LVLKSNVEFEVSSNFDALTECELAPKEAFDLVPLTELKQEKAFGPSATD